LFKRSVVFFLGLIIFVSFGVEGVFAELNPRILEKEEMDFFPDHIKGYRIFYDSDGLKVRGYLVRPAQEGEFPLLIFNRGGNRDFGMIEKPQLGAFIGPLVMQGYTVLASQYRGVEGGEGREEFGGEDVRDVLNILKIGQELPYTKEDQVVMLGFSRGGMMTYLAIKHGAPLRAAAVVAAPADLKANYEYREREMEIVMEELIGGTPEEKPEEYQKRSAVYWPEKLEVPLLMLHGDADWRVSVDHTTRLAEKLEDFGLSHRKVIFPDGDHNLSGYTEEMFANIFSWFEEHLDLTEEEWKELQTR